MNQKIRCSWCQGSSLYKTYHDTEWGVPLYDDQKLFEFLILETFQAGLSWITVLKKRENFRAAYDGFDFTKIAEYNDSKLESLMNDSGIIRNRLKIEATVKNAQAFIKIRALKDSFSNYICSVVDGKPIQNAFAHLNEIPTTTPLAETISKDLKQHGFKFIGPTVVYAHMQATGMVNDHITGCFRYQEVQKTI